MTIGGGNFMFHHNKVRCFCINESSSFSDVYKRAINFNTDIDGLLIEHKNWYTDSSGMSVFDPRLYIVVKGFDNIYYAVSFNDYQRRFKIMRYDNKYLESDYVETNIVKAETLMDDYVLAKVSNILDLISPSDPLNIYGVDHTVDDDESSEYHTYSLDTNAIMGLKTIIGINKLRSQGVKQIVIGSDQVGIDYFNIFCMKAFFHYHSKNTLVPKHFKSYTPYAGDLVICNYSVAREYEKNGYKYLEIVRKDANESILSRRLEGRDKYDRH